MASASEPIVKPSRGIIAWSPVVALVLGASLWAQLALFGLRNEIAAGAEPGRLFVYFVPFVFLAVGIATRLPALIIAAFPLSLLPAAALAAEGGTGAFEPWGAAQLCATVALYLAVSSNWLTFRPSEGESERGEPSVRRAAGYRRFVYARILPLTLLWAVPTYAIFWDPAIVGTLAQNHGEAAVTAQIFMAVLVFFAWCILAYMYYIVPALNLEYDRRRIDRELRKFAKIIEPRGVYRRLAIESGVVVAVIGLLLFVV